MSNSNIDSAETEDKNTNEGNIPTYNVQLLLYDISNGLARSLSGPLIGHSIEAIWHSSVLIYGKEFYYGDGINGAPQGVFSQMCGIQPYRTVNMGETEVTEDILQSYLISIKDQFKTEYYDLINWNCNHFSNAVCHFLLGKSIPQYVLDLPHEILRTPVGQMLGRMVTRTPAIPFASTNISSRDDNSINFPHSSQSAVSATVLPEAAPSSIIDTTLPMTANEQIHSSISDNSLLTSSNYECEEKHFPTHLHSVVSALKLLQKSSATKTQKQIALNILSTVCNNIIKNPENPKFQTLKASNKAISQKLLKLPGGSECLEALGFKKTTVAFSSEHATASETVAENEEQWIFIANANNLKFLSESLKVIKCCLQDIEKSCIQEKQTADKQVVSNNEYQEEAQLLEEMGFTDKLLNMHVLREVKGNIELAITRIAKE